MILWLASYPKSGNTLVRSFLSTYFFSKDESFDFELLKNIKQYPKNTLFTEIGVNVNDRKQIAKSHLKVQNLINQNSNTFQFWKTHSSFVKMDGYSFTDLNNTLGVIYLVRDPRDVVISYAHHNNQSISETVKMINENYILDATKKDVVPVYMGSWSNHYNSWKAFNDANRYLLVKYEDLVLNKEKFFKLILSFIKKLSKSNFDINEAKIKKVINNIDFEKLKKLEAERGFEESKINEKGDKIKFFREGKINQWRDNLDEKVKNSIENVCEKEMKELGYL